MTADMKLVAVEEHGSLGRYMLRGKKWQWAEVVVLRGGSVLVHGDVDTAIYGYRYPAGSARDVIRWMANADHSYAREKAGLASGGKIAYDYDGDVARARVLEWRRLQMISGEAARAAIEYMDAGPSDEHGLAQVLYDNDAGLDNYSPGRVVGATVIFGQSVLGRLLELLEEWDAQPRAEGWFGRLVPEEQAAAPAEAPAASGAPVEAEPASPADEAALP